MHPLTAFVHHTQAQGRLTSSSRCVKFMKPSWWLLWYAHLGALAGSSR